MVRPLRMHPFGELRWHDSADDVMGIMLGYLAPA